MIRKSAIRDAYHRWLVSPLSRTIVRAGIGPSEVSLAAVVTATAAGLAFIVEPVIGGILYLLSGTLDTLDGAVARGRGGGTRAGAFLDSMLDRYAELVVLLGILGFYARADRIAVLMLVLLFLAGFGSWMVSYAQARAEGLGSSCTFGLFERPERVVVLSVAAIVSPLVDALVSLPGFLGPRPALGVGVVALAVGTNVTAFVRLARGFQKLRKEDYHARVYGQVKAYLERSFPSCDVSQEWDASGRSLVFRVAESARTILLELPADVLDNPDFEPWDERLESLQLAAALREHLRVRVTASGLEPLPWRQLAPAEDPIEEQLRESFPASDPAPRSSVS